MCRQLTPFVLMLSLLASAQHASALDILVYDNNSSFQSAQDACNGLGFPFTRAISGDFVTLLTSQTWDIVIIDLPSNLPVGPWDTELANYVNGGGRAIHSTWHSTSFTAAVQTAFEVTRLGGHNTLSFYQWNSHSLFSSPNSVPPDFTSWADVWGTNGFYLEPTGTAVAAAGFTMSPTPNQAAIVIGNSSRTIMNGFLFDDYEPADLDTDGKKDIIELIENEIMYLLGVNCGVTGPAPATTVSDDVDIVFDANDTMGSPLTVFFEWSSDTGTTWNPCATAATSSFMNPSIAVPVPIAAGSYTWDSAADLVGVLSVQTTTVRVSVDNGTRMSSCSVSLEVDNVAPIPFCVINPPPSPLGGDVALETIASSLSGTVYDLTLEYSIDAGATFQLCTMAASSPNPNPALGATVGIASFIWDSRADGVATTAPLAGVVLRMTVDDGVSLIPGDCTELVDVDNTMLCGSICGDCNVNGIGPDVIDALTAAQIAVGAVVPTMSQAACCDVDSSMNVDVIDALFMAQSAAGLPATLVCL